MKMKYAVYVALLFVCAFLFLPRTGTTEIRNLPLLIFILSLIIVSILIRFLKYVLLITKTRKSLKKMGIRDIKLRFFPWVSFFHGHYSVTFPHGDKTAQLILLSRKRKYQRYHFDSIAQLEFYRSNRVVFKGRKIRGAVMSELVETNRVGKQKIKWDDTAEIRVIIFDKLPDQITDMVKKENLGVGEKICASDTYLLDWAAFLKCVDKEFQTKEL